MNSEIVNIYIEKLIQMVTELTKTSLLQSAQIAYYEKQNSSLNKQVEDLQRSLEKALDKANTKTKKSEDF
jgi:chaperonin cofactor prefoldin